ncbi:MAG: phosphatidylserine synthase [Candidatus Westeberhardia cardiocondylae]|nr:phosphatidylserine synthase [Candidatus Westeberhardia cardiocondylae]
MLNGVWHHRYLRKLPKIPQVTEDVRILFNPKDFFRVLLQSIYSAKKRICLVVLYLERDHGGKKILEGLYCAKNMNPALDIVILVDWHRAQRNCLGNSLIKSKFCRFVTNVDWYCYMASKYPDVDVPVYGVPISIYEVFGVLHLKGFIIDDQVIYTGASLNDVYLQQFSKYRYDRYQIITNKFLADSLCDYIQDNFLATSVIKRLNVFASCIRKLKINKYYFRIFRRKLRQCKYSYDEYLDFGQLSIVPLVGLGSRNILNEVIYHLISSTSMVVTLCTPYFNLSPVLFRSIVEVLRLGKVVEVIVGDKTANDFYFSEDQDFHIVGIIPYLYEMNLYRFVNFFQRYIDDGRLFVRVWKNDNNTYHVKGIWVDGMWQLLTGHNLNPRSWKFDLENGLLFYDPHKLLYDQYRKELSLIRLHTKIIKSCADLDHVENYPNKIRKFIYRMCLMRIDWLVKWIL